MPTPNLALPFLETGQAQKEVTHNQALALLDILVQGGVLNSTTTAPPGAPTDGQAWIVAAAPTGAWTGHAGHVAAWIGGWQLLVPREGWRLWDAAADRFRFFDGAAWGDVPRAAIQVPALGGGWANAGSGNADAGYSRSAERLVSIEGRIAGGSSGSTPFTLAAGYRPAAQVTFACIGDTGVVQVEISAAGVVTVTGTAAWVSLNGIHFYT